MADGVKHFWKRMLLNGTVPFENQTVHTDVQMAYLINALEELWAACPVANGQYVRLAAE